MTTHQMDSPTVSVIRDDAPLLTTLQDLLSIPAVDLVTALTRASQSLADVLQADKIDAFLLDPATKTLVAVGTNTSPMAERQKASGLDRLPIANGGPIVRVYESGETYVTGRSDLDPTELPGIPGVLGVRSQIATALEVAGDQRGVLVACSARENFFCDQDVDYLRATARWVGMVARQAELVEQLRKAALRDGQRAGAEELITVLAHDIRTHLTPLRGRLDIVRRRLERDGRERDVRDITDAVGAVNRLFRMTSELLDVSRLEHGLFTLEVHEVDLVQIVRDIADSLSIPQITVRLVAPDPVVTMVDADRIRQAIENILGNAIKHSPDYSTVDVRVYNEERAGVEWSVVRIADQGDGISQEQMPGLFLRFSKGSSSQGLGLGLYLAHEIAAAHGGTLVATSAPGEGACFTLSLPTSGPSR